MATEDTTLELMVHTGAVMVIMEVVKMLAEVEIGKLVLEMEDRGETMDIQMEDKAEVMVVETEDRGETRVLETGVGEEEAITAQKGRKVELEP